MKEITKEDLIKYRESVARKVADQYSGVDYLYSVVYQAVAAFWPILGWSDYIDGPKPLETKEDNKENK